MRLAAEELISVRLAGSGWREVECACECHPRRMAGRWDLHAAKRGSFWLEDRRGSCVYRKQRGDQWQRGPATHVCERSRLFLERHYRQYQ
jgi:hypothetical protein